MRHVTSNMIQRWRHRLRGPITRQRVARYMRSRLARLFGDLSAHPAESAGAAPPGAYSTAYPTWIASRIRARRAEYPAPPDPGLFTIITPVYDAPAAFLTELAQSVFAQDYPFQWAISDDGSRNPQTLEVLEKICQDPRVTFVRLPKNSGITAATRAAFELATGKYIVPVDNDDLLYPDALRVMAASLERAGWPALAYSDEDKVQADSIPISPFFKPDWDPALFLNCCYIAHLCAISREAALEAEVYTDHRARGCPDLDTFSRLLARGETPLHVPEVLYSWRIHAGSTASISSRAKPYTIECQKHVWSNHLARLAPPERVEIRTNPLFGHVGMWYPARRHVSPPPVHAFVWAQNSPQQLQNCLAALTADPPYPRLDVTVLGLLTPEHHRVVEAAADAAPTGAVRAAAAPQGWLAYLQQALAGLAEDALIASLTDQLYPTNAGWAWEATGVFDVHADAVACTPRILQCNGLLASAGEHFGFGGLVGSPDRGRGVDDSGYHGWVYCQRSVSAVASDFSICRREFLANALDHLPAAASRQMLGAWLGALAARSGRRIVYTPFLTAQYVAEQIPAVQPSHEEVFEFLSRYHDLVLQDRYYSRFLQLTRGRGFELALPHERAAALNPLLTRLEGRADFVGTLEVDPNEYSPAVLQPAGSATPVFQLRVA